MQQGQRKSSVMDGIFLRNARNRQRETHETGNGKTPKPHETGNEEVGRRPEFGNAKIRGPSDPLSQQMLQALRSARSFWMAAEVAPTRLVIS